MSIEFANKLIESLRNIADFNKTDDAFREFAKKYLEAPYFKRKTMMDNLMKVLEIQIEKRKEHNNGKNNT